jgi:hypothetical protein
MSSKNDDTSGLAFMIAIVGGAAICLAVFIVMALTFLAFVLTIFALVAWNERLQIGNTVIEPWEARAFVKRGLLGAFLLPFFLAFMDIVFGAAINWQHWFYFMLFGYVAGSVGIEILIAQENQEAATPLYQPPFQQSMVAPPPAPQALPAPAKPAEPFRFASWDDEEELK